MKRYVCTITAILFCSLIVATLGCGNAAESSGMAVIDTTKIDTSDPNVKIKRLTAQLKLGPTNWRLWYERAQLLYEVGNPEGALADISKAIEYSITQPETYHFRGFLYFVKKEDSAAMRDLQRSADLQSENPETYHHIGQIKFLKKEYAKALEAYDYAIKLDSMQPAYYFSKGFLELDRGNVDQAIVEYNNALRRNPTYVKALLGLHDIYLSKKKNADQAYAYNERVLLIDSLHPVAHFNQGNFFMTRADKVTEESKLKEFQILLKIAVSEYDLSIKYDPNYTQAIYNRGYARVLLEQYPQALEDFNRVISIDGFNEKAFFMKASIQELQGDFKSALANYKRAVEIDPNFKDAAKAVKELTAKVK